MQELKLLTENYLSYCLYRKNLNPKTIKAYSIDLNQFINFMEYSRYEINKGGVSNYLTHIHKIFKPKTIKRKIACLKAFFNYLE